MGIYLNLDNRGFWKSVRSEIYVDKTGLIACTNKVINTEERFQHIYNPRSVVAAMKSRILSNYWTATETHEALNLYGYGF